MKLTVLAACLSFVMVGSANAALANAPLAFGLNPRCHFHVVSDDDTSGASDQNQDGTRQQNSSEDATQQNDSNDMNDGSTEQQPSSSDDQDY